MGDVPPEALVQPVRVDEFWLLICAIAFGIAVLLSIIFRRK